MIVWVLVLVLSLVPLPRALSSCSEYFISFSILGYRPPYAFFYFLMYVGDFDSSEYRV